MYIFLQVNTLPNYIYNVMEQMANILYTRNTLIIWLSRVFTGKEKEIDEKLLSETEKFKSHRNAYAWFGRMGLSSKFLSNNVESLLLLAFLLLKFLLLKMIFAFTSGKNEVFENVTLKKFHHLFIIELTCLSPFMVLSAFENMLNMGSGSFKEKMDAFLHIFLQMCVLGITIAGYSLNLLDTMRYRKKFKKKEIYKKRASFNIIESNEKNSFYLLCFLIPTLIIFRNKAVFFGLITALIAWRLVYFFRKVRFYSKY